MAFSNFSDSSEINKFIVKTYPRIKRRNASLMGTVSSWSMAPLLGPGMKVKFTPINYLKLEVGDIVCFTKNKFIAHRLIKKNKENFTTKGDNNPHIDKPISSEKIFGRVTKIIINEKDAVDLNSAKSRSVTKILTWHSILISKFPFLLKIIKGRRLFLRMIYGKNFY